MTNAIRITIHRTGDGVCSLTGKQSDGVTVTFEDGTVTDRHLSWRSFRQLLAMKSTAPTSSPAPLTIAPRAAAAAC